jgi:hypothetical protein
MKNKRIRLIALVLTLAMAFSICAVPASAATATDENVWAYGVLLSNLDGPCYFWYTEAEAREEVIAAWYTKYPNVALTEDNLTELMEQAKAAAKENDAYIFYEGDVPSNAYLGYSKTKDSTIYWYTKTDILNAYASAFSVDWSTGTLTYTYDLTTKNQIKAINQVSTSSGSSSDSGAVILLAGGAVVVAGVGLYLYTHPAVVQQIKNFFTGNSAAKAAAESTEAAAESAGETAAENTVELPAEADAAA